MALGLTIMFRPLARLGGVFSPMAAWRSRRSRASHGCCRNASGLTLVEVLIALAIAGAALAVAGSMLVQHMRLTRSLELAQRQRDNATRLDYLIQVEAGEAAEIRYDQSMDNCSAEGKSLFSFVVPKSTGGYQSSGNDSFIHYYNSSVGDVRRCGPPVNDNGTLDHAANGMQNGIAVRDAVLVKDPGGSDCPSQLSNSGEVVYRLTYSSGYKPACSVVVAKTIYIN